jgi:hypothetical protein
MVHSQTSLTWMGLLLLLGAASFSSGCALRTAAERLERARLLAEKTSLTQLQEQLTSPAFEVGTGDIRLFVGRSLVNRILEGAAGVVIPVPGHPNLVIDVASIQYEATDGPGGLHVLANARELRGAVSVPVRVFARPQVTSDAGSIQLQVVVEDVAPEFSWKCLRIGAYRMARRVAAVPSGEWSRTRFALSLPLQATVEATLDGRPHEVVQQLGDAEVVFSTSRPRTARGLGFSVKWSWFLRDGIHIVAANEEHRQ